MSIDYTLTSGARGGLTFEFVPTFADSDDAGTYFTDRSGPDVFSIAESAYLFLEKAVAKGFPEYGPYHHWGVSWISAAQWSDILDNLAPLRADILAQMPPAQLLETHVPKRNLLDAPERFDPAPLAVFLDQFERRVRDLLTRYPYLVIGGI